MPKQAYHPKAYLSRIKNVTLGLRARTKILEFLEIHPAESACNIGKGGGMRYSVIMHHLWLLEEEGLVLRTKVRPIVWTLTGSGQSRLTGST